MLVAVGLPCPAPQALWRAASMQERPAPIRCQLIRISVRIIRSGRRTTLRLPAGWPWCHGRDAISGFSPA